MPVGEENHAQKIAGARERFEAILDDAKVLREHARSALVLDTMILGIIVVAEQALVSLGEHMADALPQSSPGSRDKR
jgi:hypothetical protein